MIRFARTCDHYLHVLRCDVYEIGSLFEYRKLWYNIPLFLVTFSVQTRVIRIELGTSPLFLCESQDDEWLSTTSAPGGKIG